MTDKAIPVDLYKKHRPRRFKDMVGQSEIVGQFEEWLTNDRVPNAILLVGPSGVGKTTLARIVKNELGCSKSDYQEINAADSRGIDTVRDISVRIHLSPMGGGKARVWIIDEAAKLTGDAQTALLKVLEDGPPHAYFFLCTTDPQKLLKTIITRCTELKFRALTKDELLGLLSVVAAKENNALSANVAERIAEAADGSARKALVLLHQVMGLANEEEQLNAVQKSDSRRQAIELARILMNERTPWPKVVEILNGVDEEPESLRRMILSYYQKVLLGGGPKAPRAAELIERFADNYYDVGRAGLVLACWGSLRK